MCAFLYALLGLVHDFSADRERIHVRAPCWLVVQCHRLLAKSSPEVGDVATCLFSLLFLLMSDMKCDSAYCGVAKTKSKQKNCLAAREHQRLVTLANHHSAICHTYEKCCKLYKGAHKMESVLIIPKV